MKKLSFSIPSSKSKPKPKPSSAPPQPQPQPQNEDPEEHQNNHREYVTVFDPSKPSTSNQPPSRVIPPIPNEYQPHKRMKNLHDLPSLQATHDVRFEVESLDAHQNDAANGISFGLNLRSRQDHLELPDTNGDSWRRPEDLLLEKLRSDLNRLPEHKGAEEYEDMPVESFAKSLLAGYGWYEGRGVGRNAKEDVKVKMYQKRSGGGMQGLGYSEESSKSNRPSTNGIAIPTSVTSNNNNTNNVNDDSSDNKRDQKVKERERKGVSERDEDHDRGRSVGKQVRVIGGKRDDIVGSKGMVVETLNSDWLVLKLARTEERVKLHVGDVADLGSKQEHKFLKQFKELKIGEGEKQTRGISESRSSVKSERGVQWLRSNIRVRVISKDLKGGKLYLKKGEVVDVVGPYTCDISMDESRELVQTVDQDLLETALPRRGGPVLVLYGKYKGKFGNLVQRDLDNEVGVVQDSGTHELLNVKLEQIAEYMGDPSSIGY